MRPGSSDRPVQADHQIARVVTRLSVSFILRALLAAAAPFGGDVMLAVVTWGIMAANVEHIDHPTHGEGDYHGLDLDVPDDRRRPISILALAQSLGLPYETTRRYVNRLLDMGVCQRTLRGVIVTGSALAAEGHDRALLANVGNLRRLLKDLRRLGINLE